MSPVLARRALFAAAAVPIAGAHSALALPVVGAHPDAELIRLCAEHVANHAAFNASGSIMEAEHDPLWHAYAGTLDAITTTPARTLRGITAKARVALMEATQPDGDVLFDCTVAGQWAADVVCDLLALAPGAAA